MRGIIIAGLLVLAAGALLVDHVWSQPPGPREDGRPPRGDRRDDGGPPGGGPRGFRPPPPPIIQALDVDKDGELSADEIKAASENLLKLDKDQDGKLSHDETRPAPPPGDEARPGGRGPRGPGGPRGEERGPRRGPGRGPGDDERGDRGPGGPEDDRGPTPPPHGKPPELGHVLPPFVRDEISLSDDQKKQIAELESETKERLTKILTAEQKAKCERLMERGPGGPPPRGPGGPGGRGPRGRGEGPGGRPAGDRPPRDGDGRPERD